MFIRSSLRRFFLRVLRSGLPLPGYSDAPQRGRARNADGQSESYSSSARRVTQRVHPGLHRARLGFFEYQFAPPWSATDGPILCPASVATHAGVDWCRLRPTGPAVGRADTWRPTGLAVGRADAWRLCATRVDGAALSTGGERSAAARSAERLAASSPSISNLWVGEMTQLDAGISGGKAPIHWLARPIALFHPGVYFVAQRVDVGYPPIQTLS